MAATVEELMRELRALLEQQGLRLQEIDARLGWPKNRTSKLFRQAHRPRIDEIFAVLQAAGLEPATFWRRLAGGPEDPLTRRLLEVLDETEELKRQLRGGREGGR
jgi:predicted XRE-type DNA-binding protein